MTALHNSLRYCEQYHSWCDEQFWLNWWHPVIMSFNVMQMVCFQKHLITGKGYTAYLQERAIQHIKIQLLAIHIIVVYRPNQNHSHVINTSEGIRFTHIIGAHGYF